jgi:hypothetical protein
MNAHPQAVAQSFADLMQRMETSPPRFHEWGGAPRVGGLGPQYLLWLNSLTSRQSDLPQKVAIETGAGISSLFFLAQQYTLYSFSLAAVINRLQTYLDPNPEYRGRWHPFAGFSEETLPAFACQQQAPIADFCFLDGAHSIGSVFLDFIYLNRSLKQNGILVIDDTQLPGPCLLAQMLQQLPEDFRSISSHNKAKGFEKLSSKTYLHDNMPALQLHFPTLVE